MLPKIYNPIEYFETINRLAQKNWMLTGQVGEMIFNKDGKIYDLSVADLNQLDYIEKEGLFVKN